MKFTPVSDEVVQMHWPKFGYAFSAAAFAYVAMYADKPEFFKEHIYLSMGLGITIPLCCVLSAAVDYVGWGELSLVQQALFFVSLSIGQITIGRALFVIHPAIGVGVLIACLVLVMFTINNLPQKKAVTENDTSNEA